MGTLSYNPDLIVEKLSSVYVNHQNNIGSFFRTHFFSFSQMYLTSAQQHY